MPDNRPRVYDTARAIRQRARTRALERLRLAHPVEFRALVHEELILARAEVAKIEKAGAKVNAPRSATARHQVAAPRVAEQTQPTIEVPEPAAPAILLRRGPRGDAPVEDRIRTDVATCPACINRHDDGHRCPICGSVPQLARRVIPPQASADRPKRKWEIALERDQAAAAGR